MGNYCNDWQRNEGNDTRWCFVSPSQQCHREMMQQDTCLSTGKPCIKSGGPCTDSVDSRSLVVTEALEMMDGPLIMAALLGTMLLLSGVCAIVASSHNQKMQDKKKSLLAQDRADVAEATDGFEEFKSDNDRFEEAQREAVTKLKDSTPSDVKFLLYGYYMQATEGDCRGKRPSLITPKDRAKWDAWNACKNMTREEAINKYCKCVTLI